MHDAPNDEDQPTNPKQDANRQQLAFDRFVKLPFLISWHKVLIGIQLDSCGYMAASCSAGKLTSV